MPTPVTVEGLRFVLFYSANGDDKADGKRQDEGGWSALRDRCPHRSARLSDGRVTDGTVECLYHGWRFAAGGGCVHIPQLAPGAAIPAGVRAESVRSCVVDGMLWIGPENDDAASAPSAVAALARTGLHCIDFAIDLPYAHDALIENVLDFAHIHVAHDGARGGGARDAAGPLAFDVEDRGARGFHATFVSPTVDRSDGAQRTETATVAFDAPGLVRYETTFRDRERVVGLLLYAVPIDGSRCRLLYRAYGNHWPQRDRERPRWREHLHQMHLLEQDMAVVLGQSETIRADGRPLRQQWQPLKTSDPLVLAYRRWVDANPQLASDSVAQPEVGSVLGWTTAPSSPGSRSLHAPDLSREALHTRLCSDCRDATERYGRRAKVATSVAVGAALAAAALPWPLGLLPAIASGAALMMRRDSLRVVASLLDVHPARGHDHDGN